MNYIYIYISIPITTYHIISIAKRAIKDLFYRLLRHYNIIYEYLQILKNINYTL
jgi:hypothetical protein